MTAALPPQPLIAANHLCVKLGGVEVLHDISMSVHPGEIVTILGPTARASPHCSRRFSGWCRPNMARFPMPRGCGLAMCRKS